MRCCMKSRQATTKERNNSNLGGGFNPFEKYLSKWKSSPTRGENKKYFKPPPSNIKQCITLKATEFRFQRLYRSKCVSILNLQRRNNSIIRFGPEESGYKFQSCLFTCLFYGMALLKNKEPHITLFFIQNKQSHGTSCLFQRKMDTSSNLIIYLQCVLYKVTLWKIQRAWHHHFLLKNTPTASTYGIFIYLHLPKKSTKCR